MIGRLAFSSELLLGLAASSLRLNYIEDLEWRRRPEAPLESPASEGRIRHQAQQHQEWLVGPAKEILRATAIVVHLFVWRWQYSERDD